jgi:hypothetical protein
MCKVKAKIMPGDIRSERIARIKTVSGCRADVIVSNRQVGRNHILAAEIGRDKNKVLIELPQETSAGDWRIWVNENQILKSAISVS